MELKLIPEKNFDEGSVESIKKLIKIAEKLLSDIGIPTAKNIEFYDEIGPFSNRILDQVENYGLTKDQSKEFIKASLNSGTYGTFNIEDNAIIEMNFNPHFKTCYPASHFLSLLIHESLHLFLYSKLKEDIYSIKFKFKNGEYIGENRIIQLDEGFAELITDKILEGFDFDEINNWPIYSGVNDSPEYEKNVDELNIIEFNKKFDEIYEKNCDKGYSEIETKFNDIEGDLNKKIVFLTEYVKEEIEKLSMHK